MNKSTLTALRNNLSSSPMAQFTLISSRGSIIFGVYTDSDSVSITVRSRTGQSLSETMTREDARKLYRELEKSGYRRF